MNLKKNLIITSILIFLGTFLRVLGIVLLNGSLEKSFNFFIIFDLIPEVALAAFILFVSGSDKKDFLAKVRKILLGIFVFCGFYAVFHLIFYKFILPYSYSFEICKRVFSVASYFDSLPFSRIGTDIASFFRLYIKPWNILFLVGDGLVLFAFIRTLVLLGRALRNEEKPDFASAEQISVKRPMVGFREAISQCLFYGYFSFDGCSTRAEYWWFYLFCSLVSGLLMALQLVAKSLYYEKLYFAMLVLMVIFSVFTILPSISVAVRRMHDSGHRGFFIIIPIVGFVLLFMPSVESSEFRSGRSLYTTANLIGKILVSLMLVIYVIYMIVMLRTLWFFL